MNKLALFARGLSVASSFYIVWVLVQRADLYPHLAMLLFFSSFMLVMHGYFLIYTWMLSRVSPKAALWGSLVCTLTAALV